VEVKEAAVFYTSDEVWESMPMSQQDSIWTVHLLLPKDEKTKPVFYIWAEDDAGTEGESEVYFIL